MSRRPLFTAVTSLAAILILAAGCGDQSPTASNLSPVGRRVAPALATQTFPARTYSAVIDENGGTLDFGVGRIVFPAGALEHATTISATVDGSTMSVNFQPHGIQFPTGASPVLSFDGSKVDADLGNIQIFYVDDNFRVLESETTFSDIGGHTVNAQLHHFSVYAAAVG